MATVALVGLPVLVCGTLTFIRNQDYGSSLSLWRDTVAKRPDNARARCNLGSQLLMAGRLDEAGEQFERGIRLDPRHTLLYHNRALLYRALGQRDRAIEQHTQAIALAPRVAELFFALAETHTHFGQLDRAIADYQKTLQLDPACHEANRDLAALFHRLDQFETAVELYSQALRLQDDPEVRCSRAHAFLRLGRLQQALSDYDRVIKRDADHARAYLGRAYAHRQAGHDQLADRDATRSAQLGVSGLLP